MVSQYAGPQTNRLTVKVAVKAAKAASPSNWPGSLFARRRTRRDAATAGRCAC